MIQRLKNLLSFDWSKMSENRNNIIVLLFIITIIYLIWMYRDDTLAAGSVKIRDHQRLFPVRIDAHTKRHGQSSDYESVG